MNSPTLKSYQLGFVASVLLTLAAYALVVKHALPGGMLVTAILVLAFVQMIVQMIFFLYIGSETGPRWNLMTFITTATLILIIVVGSV